MRSLLTHAMFLTGALTAPPGALAQPTPAAEVEPTGSLRSAVGQPAIDQAGFKGDFVASQ